MNRRIDELSRGEVVGTIMWQIWTRKKELEWKDARLIELLGWDWVIYTDKRLNELYCLADEVVRTKVE